MSPIKSLSIRFPNAVVVHANYAQLVHGKKHQYPHVESRMVLWCKAGTGKVWVNGSEYLMEPNRYLFIPWGHQIRYEPDEKDPFLLAGIHLIPNHAPKHPITYLVAHRPTDSLAHSSFRKDLSIPEFEGLKTGWLDPQKPLVHLLEYTVLLFNQGPPPSWLARQMASQILHELIRSTQQHNIHEMETPMELERMKQYILSNISRPLSLRDLVKFSKLSPATIGRMFRKYLKVTPVTWILQMKMERAKNLLRTQRLSVMQVGEQVGIPDTYYFSKTFKKYVGLSPLKYRTQAQWI